MFLHLGLEGSGAGFIEPALLTHAETLAGVGVTAPATSTQEMFRVALEVRRLHKDHGYKRTQVDGTWAALCRRFRRGTGAVVLGQELLAAADPQQAALLLDSLAGFDVHLVFTVRDPGTQLTSAWAEQVKAGETLPLRKFLDRIFAPERDFATARWFWQSQDVEAVLARWSRLVRPGRIHVLPVPQLDDPRQPVWEEFGRLVGFDAADFPLGQRAVQPALGTTEVAVLREVNRAIDGRIEGRLRRTVVKRYFAERVLGDPDAGATSVPEERFDDVVKLAESWQKAVAEGGYDVRGNLDVLIPTRPAGDAVSPDEVKPLERLRATTEALAQVLVEVARLRDHNEQLEERNEKLEKKKARLKQKLLDRDA